MTELSRRDYLGAFATGLTGLSGCVSGEKPEEVSVNELLENPEAYEGQEILTTGFPEYKGEKTFTEMQYDVALERYVPKTIEIPTYAINTENGSQEIPFETEFEQDTLQNLDEGETLEEAKELTGTPETVKRDGEEIYMIRNAEVQPVETETSS